MMGCPDNEIGRNVYEEAQHQVMLTRDYYVGVFQCTQRQYELVTGYNPSGFKGATLPVEGVSYNILRGKGIGSKWPDDFRVNADSFFGLLQARTGLPLDLPTEAEWEYACRAGTTTALNSGKNLTAAGGRCPNLDALGWYYENSTGTTHPVGLKKPNAWGLYDMHGNVFEWCLDWSTAYHYTTACAAVEDPLGPSLRELRYYERFRVLRGGSWKDSAMDCRSARASNIMPFLRIQDYIGFRVALRS